MCPQLSSARVYDSSKQIEQAVGFGWAFYCKLSSDRLLSNIYCRWSTLMLTEVFCLRCTIYLKIAVAQTMTVKQERKEAMIGM